MSYRIVEALTCNNLGNVYVDGKKVSSASSSDSFYTNLLDTLKTSRDQSFHLLTQSSHETTSFKDKCELLIYTLYKN